MPKCSSCGGGMWRVHRTLLQRLHLMAIFQCRDCGAVETQPRRYTFYFGEFTRCPRCGTQRVSRLQEPDRIDPFYHSIVTWWRLFLGEATIYHCCLCRIQYYDRRPRCEEPADTTVPSDSTPAPATARK